MGSPQHHARKNLVDLGEKTHLKNRLQTQEVVKCILSTSVPPEVSLLLETAGGSHPPRNEQKNETRPLKYPKRKEDV